MPLGPGFKALFGRFHLLSLGTLTLGVLRHMEKSDDLEAIMLKGGGREPSGRAMYRRTDAQ